jgi:hypothetical protein
MCKFGLLSVLCSFKSELDPDAQFFYYRVHSALVLASTLPMRSNAQNQMGKVVS